MSSQKSNFVNHGALRVLVTGADGFIGSNLVVRLRELSYSSVIKYGRYDSIEHLPTIISNVDAIIHLAGVNRSENDEDFNRVNTGLTLRLCDLIEKEFVSSKRKVSIILTSSIHAECDTSYGMSKLAAEQALASLAKKCGNPNSVFRLPGVFGKWCRPNYNSVVATFCHNIANEIPIKINEPNKLLRLVYIDDVVTALIEALNAPCGLNYYSVKPEFETTPNELACQINSFRSSRSNLLGERVGAGFLRALYSTYMSYIPTDQFAYDIPCHSDPRGVFVEMLKTPDCGQFSYFTALPGATRGSHYHHTKSEKFLVIKGEALFRFRHINTGQFIEIRTSGGIPKIVDTIPGWAHDITNVGTSEMIVILWANEIFDREKPDTVASKV